MNEYIKKAIEALDEYYKSPLPTSEQQWEEEAIELKAIPNIENLAIKRRRAAFGTPLVEAAEMFRALDADR